MRIIFIIVIIFYNQLFAQCTGCNDSFQSADLWGLNKICQKYIENYNDCNSSDYFSRIIPNYDSNLASELGSQNWNKNKLDYFHLFDNRYLFNEITLGKLESVKVLLLDGVPISINNKNSLLKFESEYLLFRQNGFYSLLSNIEFSPNLKYISLDENNFFGAFPDNFFNYPELINLSIEFNNLSDEIPEDLSGAIKLKNLTINNNKLSGNIPESICQLKDLKVLHLQYNELNKLPECICEMRSRGVEIELYGNKFCKDVPECIENHIGFQGCF